MPQAVLWAGAAVRGAQPHCRAPFGVGMRAGDPEPGQVLAREIPKVLLRCWVSAVERLFSARTVFFLYVCGSGALTMRLFAFTYVP